MKHFRKLFVMVIVFGCLSANLVAAIEINGYTFDDNSATLTNQWFPINERAIAVGIATLAQFVGIITVMILTPLMIVKTASGACHE